MTTIALHPTPQIRDAAAEAMLDEIYPEVLDLVTAAIESTTEGVEIESIEVHVSRQPNDGSGWRELVFTIQISGSEDDAFNYWHRLEDYIEGGTDALSPQSRQQLVTILSIEVVSPYAY